MSLHKTVIKPRRCIPRGSPALIGEHLNDGLGEVALLRARRDVRGHKALKGSCIFTLDETGKIFPTALALEISVEVALQKTGGKAFRAGNIAVEAAP
jgi:hypothetical protein